MVSVLTAGWGRDTESTFLGQLTDFKVEDVVRTDSLASVFIELFDVDWYRKSLKLLAF